MKRGIQLGSRCGLEIALRLFKAFVQPTIEMKKEKKSYGVFFFCLMRSFYSVSRVFSQINFFMEKKNHSKEANLFLKIFSRYRIVFIASQLLEQKKQIQDSSILFNAIFYRLYCLLINEIKIVMTAIL